MDNRLEGLENDFLAQLRRFKRIKPSQSMMPEGITPNEGFALKSIELCSKTGGQCRPGTIAQLLHITKSSASQIFRSLGDKGLITREQSTDDFRAATLSLTDAGKAVIVEMDKMRETQFHKVVNEFGVDNLEQLVDLLDKFATCMEDVKGVSDRGTRA